MTELRTDRRIMYRWILLIVFLMAVVAGLTVGALNPVAVTFDLIFVQMTLPLGALVFASAAVGIVLGLVAALVLFMLPGGISGRRRRRKDNKGASLTDRSDA